MDTAEIKEPAAVTATASSADKTTPATPDKKVCKVVGPSRNIESEHKQATDDWPLHGVVSATACAHECEEEESCTAIHYYSDILVCYLHGERKPCEHAPQPDIMSVVCFILATGVVTKVRFCDLGGLYAKRARF